ncbi:MAG: hypothetical protein R3E86_05290 [Pseudomonadales bacterium]
MTTLNTAQTVPLAASSADPARAARPSRILSLLTALGYALVAACIGGAWLLRDENLIHAGSGTGYWLGITGASLMGLLLLYPLRKRSRLLRGLGPVSVWFRLHMALGIIGPLLIILHSNFQLGSFNGRVAMFATLVVAGSGIIGRYFYAKLHHGLYGRKVSLGSLRDDVEAYRERGASPLSLVADALEELANYEARLLEEHRGLFGAFLRAFSVVPETALLRWRLMRQVNRSIRHQAARSSVIQSHRKRLRHTTRRYLTQRIQALRKFAQFRAFETLFSLWHVVHYPLFLVLVVAVIVHVVAVHMY